AAAARSLSRGRRTLLTTGFTVGPGQPETDGPPGTAVLGRALRRLGHKVTYVTDAVTVPALEAALDALGEPTAVLAFDGAPDAIAAARRVLAAEAPTHLVSIERPGRRRGAPDGGGLRRGRRRRRDQPAARGHGGRLAFGSACRHA